MAETKKPNGNKTASAHLRRIIGQLAGVEKMLATKKSGMAVVSQVIAAKASLEQLAIKILREEAKVCQKKNLDKIVDTFFRVG
jgi:DNA-binding FrmR family transcriptional regulator